MASSETPEHIWDFSPPNIDGVSWRDSHITVHARSIRQFETLKQHCREQGDKYNDGDGTYFTFQRPTPGTHNGSMRIMVICPTPNEEDIHAYDDWSPGQGYVRP